MYDSFISFVTFAYKILFFFLTLLKLELKYWYTKGFSYIIIGPSYNVQLEKQLLKVVLFLKRAELNRYWKFFFKGE